MNDEQEVRLDKWLQVARFYKKREDAAAAIDNGWVLVNGERAKAARHLKVGDEVSIKDDGFYRKYTIQGLAKKPVSKKVVHELYDAQALTAEEQEMVETKKLMEGQVREQRRAWKESFDDKKKRRDLNRHKYGE